MMRAYRIEITRTAKADLFAIGDYVARDSPKRAIDTVDQINDALESLKHLPYRTVYAGQPPGLLRPVRTMPVSPYMVFFRVIEEANTVRVLRVRHSARRPLKFR